VNLWIAFNAEVPESGMKAAGRASRPSIGWRAKGASLDNGTLHPIQIALHDGSWLAGRRQPSGDRARSAEAAPSRSLAIEPVEIKKP